MTVRATYRLQFTADFRFADARALAPYLAGLGVSHVYASPILAARRGSTHGYDVVDFNRLNPELGGEADFLAMTAALRAEGLGLIVDFVPNHMGVGGSDNDAWLDVLEWGPESPFAAWFDIDWNAVLPGPVLAEPAAEGAGNGSGAGAGRILVPFLGDHYGAALAAGALQLRFDAEAGGFAVWAHDTHKLPICPRHYGAILREAPALVPLADAFDALADAPPGDPRRAELQAQLADADPAAVKAALGVFAGAEGEAESWAALDALIGRQSWRPSRFTLDGDAINYRRFFTISDLAGIRVEDPRVFDETHRLILRHLAAGEIDGLRIDHIDGLLDPRAYLSRLRGAVDRPFPLYVENILGPDEPLPPDWECDGTTGYEFANLVVGLLVDPVGEEALSRHYAEATGRTTPPEQIVRAAKHEVMAQPMAAELEALTVRLLELAARDPRRGDMGRAPLRAALAEAIAALDVYRTYTDADGISADGRARVEAAVARAAAAAPELDPDIFDFLAAAMTGDMGGEGDENGASAENDTRADVIATAMRLQQLTGPVMAKGLEDTALYRFNRLIALNEVGSEPGHFGETPGSFHRASIARLAHWPHSMLGTSTHDTKRGEDARARIAAIAGQADLWASRVAEWRRLLDDPAQTVDPNESWFFFQLLLGAWPADWPRDAAGETAPGAEDLGALRERVTAAMLKSSREAKVNTRWVFGDPAYEAALEAYVARALDPAPGNVFLRSFRDVEARLAPAGAANSLIQTALKLTVPGAPDIYQGAELWDQSLVDPDNRRPVNFARRAALLARLDGNASGRHAPGGAAGSDGAGPGAAGLNGAEPAPNAPPSTAWLDGKAKFALTARLLDFRRRKPALFAEGAYRPLEAEGPAAQSFLGFTRSASGDRLVVAAALHFASATAADWAATTIEAPNGGGRWRNLLSDEAEPVTDWSPTALFRDLPVAVLTED